MTRRLKNWTYRELTGFLREKGFRFHEEKGGSHQAWIKRGYDNEEPRIVGIHFTHGTYRQKAMKRMIYQSGIDEEEWIEWGSG